MIYNVSIILYNIKCSFHIITSLTGSVSKPIPVQRADPANFATMFPEDRKHWRQNSVGGPNLRKGITFMRSFISALCLSMTLLLSAGQAFGQSLISVTVPPATPPAPSVETPEFFGQIEHEEFLTPNAKIGGGKITYFAKGSESSRQAGINHRKGVDQHYADRAAMRSAIPKTVVVEKPVVKTEVRYVAVPPPPVFRVYRLPVKVYHNGYYTWE